MTNTQRVIFDLPDNITAADIFSDILQNNGIGDITNDLISNTGTPKLVTINNITKDFFMGKLSEEKLIILLENELNIAEKDAINMVKEIKEKIIPFAKKINTGTEEAAKIIPIAPLKSIAPQKKEIEQIMENKIKPIKNASRGLEAKEIKKNIKLGPDNYREPIE